MERTNKLAVVITTRNDENHIVDCVRSAKLLTSEVVVLDMQSSDNTISAAKEMGAKAYSIEHFSYVEPARNMNFKKTTAEWVLILDPDERMTQELAQEIKETLSSTPYTHFKIPRKNMFAGKKWLKHGGWWPDYQLRLIKRDSLIDWPDAIHSTPQIEGKGGRLKNPFSHLMHGSFEKMVEKTLVFEDIESGLLLKGGVTAKTSTFLRKFLGELNRRLLGGRGFLDGDIGIIESIYQAFSKTITYLMLYEKRRKH